MSRSYLTINTTLIVEDSTDPITLGGIAAPKGSLYLAEDGSGAWYKSGDGDLDWTLTTLPTPPTQQQAIGASFSGSGGVINISSIVTLISKMGGTITSWRVAGSDGETGSCVLDLKSGGVSLIGAGNKPTISGANAANAPIAGWTTATLSANGIYEINIESLSTFTRLIVLFYFE